MKAKLYLFLFFIACSGFQLNAQDKTDKTNDFFDNEETIALGKVSLEILGEIKNPGKVDFSKLQKHSVIVKEAILKNNKDTFVGAYRYDGYSLYDIMNLYAIKDKPNEFNSVINYFLEIENAKGEKTVVSWGEIYYPNHRHEILVATDVMRIIPSKTKELWTLPTEPKLVVAGDIVTERNISSPTKIIIRSYPKNIPDKKGLKPLYSESFKIFDNDKEIAVIKDYPKADFEIYPCVFYGRGRGIHGIDKFKGIKVKDFLVRYFPENVNNIKNAVLLISAPDGFRAVYTYSEIFNRNDQSELLLIDLGRNDNGGCFKCFPAGDFFSDRAIKAINEIYFMNVK
ncbi:MAG: hypothetical protein A2275_18625 [Bacteroidetes bacterium RIFOXYA12_FULL_35_11]|nr:MAG: hypothetical protein A2X01_03570 [Bacteroidetes bacterium GWF2_35_48]OFY79433.1 MAG: hypothetical protein A2275_18625 [Bacteroidetes bacterium RIFOXYA12_FULL_35_11]OFY93214.1 MAG: hypothetical protein A2309_00850 [Bacteroidetes bacterium RIFOXYB2_FULL_35_7]OFY96678.1 MAG: hypothetical protein A2491_09110 [Bacteroidetes bacterium RIFOXYC12_FULL_35_7]HBX51048.1 hypothetical protein [Bacteroidales bacterium]